MSKENQNPEDDILNIIQENANNVEFEEVGEPDSTGETIDPEDPNLEDHSKSQEDLDNPILEMDGELAVELLDIAISRIGAIGFSFAKIPAHFQDFQLSAEEKRGLAPLIEKWLEYEQITLNPRWALLGTVAMIYGTKGIAVYQRHAEAKKQGVEEDLKKEVVKNKGGRPKGSKDTKPRKPRSSNNSHDKNEEEPK